MRRKERMNGPPGIVGGPPALPILGELARLGFMIVERRGAMHSVYILLSSYGFREATDLPKLDELNETQLRALHAGIYETLSAARIDEVQLRTGTLDPFRFVASASMRGESGCGEPFCRFRKLDFLNRFGALYSTNILLPIGLTSPEHEQGIKPLKSDLNYAIFTLVVSRQLVNTGYFIPTVMRTTHGCVHELEAVEKGREVIQQIVEDSIPEFAKGFRVRYQKPEFSPSGMPSFYVDGPEEFLEHGSVVYLQSDGIEPKLSKRRSFDSEGFTEVRGRDKLPFLWPVFDQIGSNTSFYLAYRMRHDARLLTDLPGEASLLEGFNEDDDFQASTVGFRALNHSLPLLSSMPIQKLLKIRSENRDSFEAYREGIASMTKRALEKGLTLPEAGHYFAEEIGPALQKINREASLEAKKQRRRIRNGIGSISASLAIGAFSAIPHLAPVAIAGAGVAALVGGNLIKKSVESACEHGADLEQSNDLYFLTKLVDEDAGGSDSR